MSKSFYAALMMSASLVLGAAAPQGPAVTAGQIVTSSFDVTKPPAAPVVLLHLRGAVTVVSFSWTGPSGESFTQLFRGNPVAGAKSFQGTDPVFPESTASKNVFGLYTEAGTWTLTSLTVYSVSSYVTYTGSQLAGLFTGLTVQIVNPNQSDITPPVAKSATITTPTVSLASGGDLGVNLAATDDLSGVSEVQVYASPPQSFDWVTATAFAGSSVLLGGTLKLSGSISSGSPTGTYTIILVYLRDVAGNLNSITDPGTIAKLFHGHASFAVTN